VTVCEELRLSLVIRNESPDESFTFENCLHTYFEVSDIAAVSIVGLRGREYLDKTANFARKTEMADAIRISSETDRIYLDTTDPVEILDARHGRKIRIRKSGSASTIVWNPWEARARQIPDFGNEEFSRMVCVESGNVGPNEITLPPGATSSLEVSIASEILS
jgi:D-hexose-6-phosphate mutarotase